MALLAIPECFTESEEDSRLIVYFMSQFDSIELIEERINMHNCSEKVYRVLGRNVPIDDTEIWIVINTSKTISENWKDRSNPFDDVHYEPTYDLYYKAWWEIHPYKHA